MELYSMPQLEKTTPVFSDSQYEGGGDNIITQRASNNDVKKFPSVSTEALPLLTSSASWSAVIHRPAEEDSEPDDLPSTVDMDAIKGSPSTPLAASKTSCNSGPASWDHSKTEHSKREESKEVDGGDDDDDDEDGASDSEDSDGDDSDSRDSDEETGDSDSVNDSGSDTEGSESDSCSWSDSDSDSPTSSCSSHSEGSSHSSHTHQTFSIRENNFDQGGFKLKIAALKINKKVPVKEAEKPDNSEKLERADKPKDTDKKKCSVAETPKSSKDDKKDKVKSEQVSAAVKSTQRCSVAKKSEVSRRKTRGCRTPLKEKVSCNFGKLAQMLSVKLSC